MDAVPVTGRSGGDSICQATRGFGGGDDRCGESSDASKLWRRHSCAAAPGCGSQQQSSSHGGVTGGRWQRSCGQRHGGTGFWRGLKRLIPAAVQAPEPTWREDGAAGIRGRPWPWPWPWP